ncbi:unnamed protein product [Ambrosiozyma monospora]|uniref:Unnamed protein product n=1 Tax=Ambrosiozyma monospora TaxID=43982 RepID=A0ACB5UA50_AMBMO|nr:unnamed protein product [Ambrosiozyma monospora]
MDLNVKFTYDFHVAPSKDIMNKIAKLLSHDRALNDLTRYRGYDSEAFKAKSIVTPWLHSVSKNNMKSASLNLSRECSFNLSLPSVKLLSIDETELSSLHSMLLLRVLHLARCKFSAEFTDSLPDTLEYISLTDCFF